MKTFLLTSIGFLMLFSFSSVQARQWDPRLFQISDLAYQGNFQQAAQIADQYLKENPNDPNAYFFRGLVYDWERNLTDLNRDALLDKAYRLYAEGSKRAFFLWDKDQKNVDKMIDLGNSYIFLGKILADKGAKLRAIFAAKKGPRHLEAALKIEPTRTDGLMTLGVFHYVADNTPKALAPLKVLFGIKGSRTQGLQELRNSLKGNHPFRNDGLISLFYVSYEFDKNYVAAHQYLDQLEAKFPNNPKLPFMRGEVMEKQGKSQGKEGYLKAARWCEAKANICPAKVLYDSYYRAGKLAKEMGQNQEAFELLQKSIQGGLKDNPTLLASALLWSGDLSEAPEQAVGFYAQAQGVRGAPKAVRKKARKALKKICSGKSPPRNC